MHSSTVEMLTSFRSDSLSVLCPTLGVAKSFYNSIILHQQFREEMDEKDTSQMD